MKTRPLVATAAVLLMVPALGWASVRIQDVTFSREVVTEDGEIPLRGAALLTYMTFIKAYVGALYLPESVGPEEALGPVRRKLVLEYFHSIPAEDFARATTRKIRDNLSEEAFAAMEDRVASLNRLYRDVRPGDRYALTYAPGRGTTLSLNGENLGRIDGDDFARAVFSIWLGERPIDKGFKRGLLGLS